MATRKAAGKLGYAALKADVALPNFKIIRKFYEQAYLRDFLKRLKINCVIDVGANKGWYSKHLRMLGYNGHIFSFEPIREDFEFMSSLAEGDPRWQTFNFAIGSENTKKSFNVIKTGSGNTVFSSFLHMIENNQVECVDIVESKRLDIVEVKRLDSLLGALVAPIKAPRIFLKVDTQGYDVEVIKGAENYIDLVVGLQSEISVTPIYEGSPHYLKALEYYESLGYSLMNLFVVNRTNYQSILEYDCFMARLGEFRP